MRAPAQADDRVATVPNVPVDLGRRWTPFLDQPAKRHQAARVRARVQRSGQRQGPASPAYSARRRSPAGSAGHAEFDVVLRQAAVQGRARPVHRHGADGFLVTPGRAAPFQGHASRRLWPDESRLGRTRSSKWNSNWWAPRQAAMRQATDIGAARDDPGTPRGPVGGLLSECVPARRRSDIFAPTYWSNVHVSLSRGLAQKRSQGEEQIPLEEFAACAGARLHQRSIAQCAEQALEESCR